MKNLLIQAILILVIAASFLFSPRPEPGKVCAEYIPLNNFSGFLLHCDAANYTLATQNPARLLQQNEMRQSRPLFILLAAVVCQPLHALLSLFGFQTYHSYQLGYIVLNFLVLLLTLYLFRKILTDFIGLSNPWLILLLQAILLSNQVTKSYFWTIHQQMFTLLAPVLCCFLACKIYDRKPAAKQLYLFAAAGGLLMLVYGNFLIILPTILFFHLKNTGFNLKNKKAWLELLIISMLFLTPTLMWIGGLKAIGIKYYNHEMEAYDQLTWILHTLADSPKTFWLALVKNTHKFLNTFGELTIFIALALFATIAVYRKKSTTHNLYTVWIPFFFFLIFLWLLGFYVSRLTFNLFPLLLLIVGVYLTTHQQKRAVLYITILFFMAWHVYNVVAAHQFG